MHIKHIHDMIEKLSECAKCEMDKGIEQLDTKEMGEVAEIIKELSEAEYYAKISKAMDESEYGEDYDEYGPIDNSRRGYRGQPRSESGRFMSRGDGRRSNRGRGGSRGYEEPMYYQMTPEMYHMYPAEYYRDMDREEMGRMYYTSDVSSMGASQGGQSSSGMSGGQSRGSSSGGSRGYSESEGGQYSSRMQREGMNESRYDRAKRAYTETKEMNKDKGEKMKNLEEYMKELSSDVTSMISDMTPEEKTLMKQKMSVLMQKI